MWSGKASRCLGAPEQFAVLITGGSNPEYAQWVFEGQGVDAQKLQLDYAARDTLSNFTTLVDRLRRRGFATSCWSPAAITWTGLCWWAVWWQAAAASSHPGAVPCGDDCRPERPARFGVMGAGLGVGGEWPRPQREMQGLQQGVDRLLALRCGGF